MLTTPDSSARVSQSVQISVAGIRSTTRLGLFAGSIAVVERFCSTIAQYSFTTRRRSNWEESRWAALDVLAQINTPEVGRSSRWTIPR